MPWRVRNRAVSMAEPKSGEAGPAVARPAAPTAAGVGRDALLYLPGRLVPSAVQILTVTVLTAWFSSEEIGQFELSLRFTVFLATLSALWLSMGVLRLHAAHEGPGQEAIFLKVVSRVRNTAIALGLALGALVYFLGPDSIFGSYRHLLPAALFAFASYGVFEIGLSVLRARRRPVAYSIATSINALTRLPLAVAFFVFLDANISGMLWALGITYALSYLFLVRPNARAAETDSTYDAGGAIQRDLMAYCWPILFAQLLNFFVNNLDRYLIKILRGDVEVGLYAIASNLVEQPMTLVLQTFALAMIPGISQAWERHGRAATEDLLHGLTRMFLLLSGLMLALLSAGAPHIFGVLARGESAAAASAAPWLAAASLCYGITYLSNLGLHLSRRTGLLLTLSAVAMGLNIAVNYVLIPRFGYDGAAMARVVSNAAMALMFAGAAAPHLKWRIPWLGALRTGISTAVTAVAVYAVSTVAPVNLAGLIVVMGVGAVVYGVMVVAAGELPMRELNRMAAKITRRG
jgi:O-antigen/teichoic acid export membrane protein